MRTPEPRITNPQTHPKRWVNLTVAADFLEMSYYALHYYIDRGDLSVELKGLRRKAHVDELVRFKRVQERRAS